jgi:cold shock CspA family protein
MAAVVSASPSADFRFAPVHSPERSARRQADGIPCSTPASAHLAAATVETLFVHHSAIVGEGYRSIAESAKVSYDIETSDKGPKAGNVQVA